MSDYGAKMNPRSAMEQGNMAVRGPDCTEGVIAQQLTELSQGIDMLDGMIGDLVGRIQPVLAPATPPVQTDVAHKQSFSPLHDMLVGYVNRLYSMRRNLEQIVARVTL
jgi:hypothetical protein